jgi:hypothetical protein
MSPLAQNFAALLSQWQSVDLDHVVEHTREDFHDLAIGLPIEARVFREGLEDEFGEIHRAEQARTICR